jgi:hypothetical protein
MGKSKDGNKKSPKEDPRQYALQKKLRQARVQKTGKWWK